MPNKSQILFEAIRDKNLIRMKQALAAGASINEPIIASFTALKLAVTYGDSEVIKLLVESGAQIDLQDFSGNTALHSAITQDKPDVIKTLIELGANLYLRNNDHLSPIMLYDIRNRDNSQALDLMQLAKDAADKKAKEEDVQDAANEFNKPESQEDTLSELEIVGQNEVDDA